MLDSNAEHRDFFRETLLEWTNDVFAALSNAEINEHDNADAESEQMVEDQEMP